MAGDALHIDETITDLEITGVADIFKGIKAHSWLASSFHGIVLQRQFD